MHSDVVPKGHLIVRRLGAPLALILLSAACSSSLTPSPAATPMATPSLRPTIAPASEPPPIGQPADDGARIISVESPSARVRDLTIDSPAVGAVRVRLLLPDRFDAQPATLWPVLYLLHGDGVNYAYFTETFDVEAMTAGTDLLVVMPDGRDGWYSDWWNGGDGGPPMWETFHLVELRQLLERNWHAGAKRAIAGISTGGYGAMKYAARQPGTFLFAGSYSGDLHPLGGNPAWLPPNGDLWGDSIAQADVWEAHDPTAAAAALKGTALYVAFGNGEVGPLDNGQPSPWDPTGEGERGIAREGAAFVQRLAELDIPVTVNAYGNGTHTEPYFERDLHDSFPLILEVLGL